MTTPREPDRLDAKARELFRSLVMDEARAVPVIAAALRAAEQDGAREARSYAIDVIRRHIKSPLADVMVRALIPPAAENAAEPPLVCGPNCPGHPAPAAEPGKAQGAEARIEQMEAAIRWACGERPLPDGRWFNPEAFGHVGSIPHFWWRSVLYREAGLSAAPPDREGK